MKISNNATLLVTGIIFIVLIGFTKFAETNNQADSLSAPPQKPAVNLPSGNAKVTIVEYSDFQCPYCSRVVPTVKKIEETYGEDVEVVFKHFPLAFHSYAKKAAEASECARDQGKFWEYHDKLFENQNKLDKDSLKKYAGELGLDANTFNKCLDSGTKTALVENNFEEGKSLGVTGTPSFFINGQKVVGAQPYEKFAEIIDVMIEVNK
ncbi:MAG: thioredoxin domain-containing protein [Methanobacteriota archaeon]